MKKMILLLFLGITASRLHANNQKWKPQNPAERQKKNRRDSNPNLTRTESISPKELALRLKARK